MSRHLHNDPEQNISASEGWQGMQLLLDKHLPVTPAPVKRRPFLFYFAAASFIGLLMLSYLHLQHSQQKRAIISGGKNTAGILSKNNDAAGVNNFSAATVPTFSPTVISSTVFENGRKKIRLETTLQDMNDRKIKNMYAVRSADMTRSTTADATDEVEDAKDPVQKTIRNKQIAAVKNMELIAGKGYMLPSGLRMYTGKPQPVSVLTSNLPVPNPKKAHGQGTWEAGAGIGMNAVIDNQINARPYPVAEIKYNFSPKVYISAGITAFSPVNSHSRSASQMVYVNDTANNLRSYNEVVKYARFEYADMPVMAGFRINNRFAVQAGAQASILISQKKRRGVMGYDFQMNPLVPAPNTPVTSGIVYTNIIDARPRKVDGRVVGGICYTAAQVSLNLSYQQGLQSSVKGSQVSSSKNRLVSLQVLYRLRKLK